MQKEKRHRKMACLIKSNEIESRTLERESPQVGSDQMLNDTLLARYITEL